VKVSKSSAQLAKRIYSLCLTEGSLDDSKLLKAIALLKKNPPSDHKGILVALKELVRLDQEAKTVTVESAEKLDSAEAVRLTNTLTKKYGEGLIFKFKVNPALIAGLKIQVGSHVFDGSLLAKINKISQF